MGTHLTQAARSRAEIAEIKRRYLTGEITREEAKALAQPILDQINEVVAVKTKALNKKYGLSRKPFVLDFINAMRNNY